MDKRLEALQGRNLPRRSLAIFSFPITKVIGRSAVKSDPISSFPIRKVQYNVARSLSEPLKTLPRTRPVGTRVLLHFTKVDDATSCCILGLFVHALSWSARIIPAPHDICFPGTPIGPFHSRVYHLSIPIKTMPSSKLFRNASTKDTKRFSRSPLRPMVGSCKYGCGSSCAYHGNNKFLTPAGVPSLARILLKWNFEGFHSFGLYHHK